MRNRVSTETLVRRAPEILLAVAALAAAAMLIAFDSHLTFVSDDWELLVRRHGFSADLFFEPYAEHLIVGPTLVWKALLSVFGMGSAMPFYVASIATFVLSGVLLFFYVRARTGDWVALLMAVLLLFLGAAFEALLLASQINYFGSMAAGLGVLIALDREDDAGDRVACALLLVAIAFSSLGLIFVAGGARRPACWDAAPRARRAYVAAGAAGRSTALWWLGWGRDAESRHSAPHNVVHAAELRLRRRRGRHSPRSSASPPATAASPTSRT